MTASGAWFVYRGHGARLTARPCNAAGWAALLGMLAAMMGACLIITPRVATMGIVITVASQLLVMAIGSVGLVWLVKRRGRRLD